MKDGKEFQFQNLIENCNQFRRRYGKGLRVYMIESSGSDFGIFQNFLENFATDTAHFCYVFVTHSVNDVSFTHHHKICQFF